MRHLAGTALHDIRGVDVPPSVTPPFKRRRRPWGQELHLAVSERAALRRCIYARSVAMRFDWDRGKSLRNLLARRFDFEFATQVFDGPTLERDDVRREYGERRVVAIGVADGLCLTVVYTDRAGPDGLVRRIISARRSNTHERQAYFQVIKNE